MALLSKMSDIDAWVPLPNESTPFLVSAETNKFDFIMLKHDAID
jgi:hypothetical protein